MRRDIIEQKEFIISLVNMNHTKASIARQLKCKPETLSRYLLSWGINYSGNLRWTGIQRKKKEEMLLIDYLATSKDIQTNKVRQKLLKEKYKEYKCECCGNTTWLDNPIPLELHHKDGNNNNNNIDNFLLLCPNCHALTDSYRGKNSRIHKCVETIQEPPKS